VQSHHYILLSVKFTITSYSQKVKKKTHTYYPDFIRKTTSCICFIHKNQIKISKFKVSCKSQNLKSEVFPSAMQHIQSLHIKTISLSLPTVETFPNNIHLQAVFQNIQECIFQLSTNALILDICVGSQNYYFWKLHTLSKNLTSAKKKTTHLSILDVF